MTVQELINKLNKVKNKELEVVIRGTDPTDWIYNNEIQDLEVEEVYFEDEDEERECFVIDGGMF
jgi:uncharacterized heparinase superfamily protein